MIVCGQESFLIEWEQSYGGTSGDTASDFLETTDGGFIFVGSTDSASLCKNHGQNDAWIVKLSKTGAIQWQKCYGGTNDEYTSAIVQSKDGGFVIIGDSNSDLGSSECSPDEMQKIWIFKITSSGELEWQNCYHSGIMDSSGSGIVQTGDGNFLTIGTIYEKDRGFDPILNKYSADGKLIWIKNLGGSVDDRLVDLKNFGDKEYIAIGTGISSVGGGKNFLIISLSESGDILWKKLDGISNGQDEGRQIQPTDDGGYIIIGDTYPSDSSGTVRAGSWDIGVIKYSNNGNIQWKRTFGGSGRDYSSSIIQTYDQGFIIVGLVEAANNEFEGHHGGKLDYYIAKLNPSGTILWEQLLGGSNREDYGDIYRISDGGYILLGNTPSIDGDITTNHGSYDVWIVKFRSDLGTTTTTPIVESKPDTPNVTISSSQTTAQSNQETPAIDEKSTVPTLAKKASGFTIFSVIMGITALLVYLKRN